MIFTIIYCKLKDYKKLDFSNSHAIIELEVLQKEIEDQSGMKVDLRYKAVY